MTRSLTHLLRLTAAAVVITACAKADAPADTASAMSGAPATGAMGADSTAMSSGAIAAPAAMTGMMDPNSATKDQLVGVSGMTPAAADALIAGRPYADMSSADKALAGAGLSADARKQAYAQLWKPIDLNKATEAEMMLIPGVGKKMAHEFEEYRPWTSAAQFEREIGKYVDKAEVARLKTYVTLP